MILIKQIKMEIDKNKPIFDWKILDHTFRVEDKGSTNKIQPKET